jgi:thiol-disulfide isomerase/thioredoxin
MKMVNKKIILSAGVIALIIAVFLFSSNGNSEPVPSVAAHLVNASGEAVDLSKFHGKIVFINNWASWCPPCVAEMPSIQNLKNELAGEDIAFVMVSFDQKRSKALAFLEKRKFDFDVYFPAEKYPFITESIPVTYVLNKEGKVIFEKTGMATYDSPEVVAQFKKLINDN